MAPAPLESRGPVEEGFPAQDRPYRREPEREPEREEREQEGPEQGGKARAH